MIDKIDNADVIVIGGGLARDKKMERKKRGEEKNSRSTNSHLDRILVIADRLS